MKTIITIEGQYQDAAVFVFYLKNIINDFLKSFRYRKVEWLLSFENLEDAKKSLKDLADMLKLQGRDIEFNEKEGILTLNETKATIKKLSQKDIENSEEYKTLFNII